MAAHKGPPFPLIEGRNAGPYAVAIWGFGLLIASRARVLHLSVLDAATKVYMLIASRARVLHLTLTYVVSFLLLAVLRNLLVGGPLLAEIAPITGPMYQLFIFFMVTDPRTTVSSKSGRILVAAVIALVEMGIRIAADHQVPYLPPLYFSPPILALFLVGPVAMFLDLRRR